MERSVLSEYQQRFSDFHETICLRYILFLTMQFGKQNFVFDEFISIILLTQFLLPDIVYCRVHYAEMCDTLLPCLCMFTFPTMWSKNHLRSLSRNIKLPTEFASKLFFQISIPFKNKSYGDDELTRTKMCKLSFTWWHTFENHLFRLIVQYSEKCQTFQDSFELTKDNL